MRSPTCTVSWQIAQCIELSVSAESADDDELVTLVVALLALAS
jgi:hypothetical protein